MFCCLIVALATGKLALAGRLGMQLFARPSAMAAAGMAVLLGGTALLAPAALAHAGHYAERAQAHDRSLLEEILAQPLCRGRDAQ